MLLCNSVVNPFIYTFQYASFKQAAKQLFCKCLAKDIKSNLNSSVTLSTSVSEMPWNNTDNYNRGFHDKPNWQKKCNF